MRGKNKSKKNGQKKTSGKGRNNAKKKTTSEPVQLEKEQNTLDSRRHLSPTEEDDDYGFLKRERCRAFRVKKNTGQQLNDPMAIETGVNMSRSSNQQISISPYMYITPNGQMNDSPFVTPRSRPSSRLSEYENVKQCYQENTKEQTYVTLSSLPSMDRHVQCDEPWNRNTSCQDLSFYSQLNQQQCGRSVSRNGRSRSPKRSAAHTPTPSEKCRTSRSRSRDIVALYTSTSSRSISSNRQRERSPSVCRHQHAGTPVSYSRSQSVSTPVRGRSIDRFTPEPNFSRSKSESRCSSVAKDAISLSSTLTVQSRCLSNSEIASENLKLWMKTTSKHQRSSSIKPEKKDDNTNFVTLLEMDTAKNDAIENMLNNANSLKPANIKMMVIAGHIPSENWESKDEIQVKAGAIVTGLYKQNEWLFIMTETKNLGFVPFAYTKPIKVTSISEFDSLQKPSKSSVVKQKSTAQSGTRSKTGILKTSKQKQSNSEMKSKLPKYSVKVKTVDNESVSSEASSFLDDFVYTRKPTSHLSSHADCIVINTDDVEKYEFPHVAGEEIGTYCSDSGISEPNSTHSDDFDSIHSPMLPMAAQVNSKSSTPRSSVASNGLPNERVVSVTTELLTVSPAVSRRMRLRHQDCSTPISQMPLGPLGQRLSQQTEQDNCRKKSDGQHQNYAQYQQRKQVNSDSRARARASSNLPAFLRPEIPKDYNGPRFTVVFDYEPENDDDLQVHASDVVTVLNNEDTEWIWVQRRDGKEGFIPKEYAIPLVISRQQRLKNISVAL